MRIQHEIVRILTTAILLVAIQSAEAQLTAMTIDQRVYTVEFRHSDAVDRTSGHVPQWVVCHLASPETLSLDFDVVGGETETLYYKFVHCDRHWQSDDLMDMEFVEGINRFDGFDEASLSFNTTTAFVHYHLNISTSPLLVSGNYWVEVRQSTDDRLILRQPLWLTEDICGVNSRVERTQQKQKISLNVVPVGFNISSPEEQLQVSVWQNKRADDMRILSSPTFFHKDFLTYQDDDELSFDGGTEWLWADTRSIRQVAYGDARIEYHAPLYHYTLSPDLPRAYTYREDFNGGSWIETHDRVDDVTIVADYAVVHFTLLPEDVSLLQSHEFYVIGDATGWEPEARNKLQVSEKDMCATGQALVKQGLHNYLYVARRKERRPKTPNFADALGSFGQTENDYYIAVYVRLPQDTFDRLATIKIHNTLRTPDQFVR